MEIKGGAPYLFGDDDVRITDNGALPGFSGTGIQNQGLMLGGLYNPGLHNRANTSE